MRDSNDKMIGLLEISLEHEIYSVTIQHVIENRKLKLRFNIDKADYSNLYKILSYRPFLNSGEGSYRYFFEKSYRRNSGNPDLAYINVRVEQLNNHKQFEFPVSKKFVANLLWFSSTATIADVEAMIIE